MSKIVARVNSCLEETESKTIEGNLNSKERLQYVKVIYRICPQYTSIAFSRQHRLLQCLLQFPTLVCFHYDIATAEELSVNVELRKGRPTGILLEALAQHLVLQNVHGFNRGVQRLKDLHHGIREAALRKILGALHEEDYLM